MRFSFHSFCWLFFMIYSKRLKKYLIIFLSFELDFFSYSYTWAKSLNFWIIYILMEKLWLKVARPEEKILQLLFFLLRFLKYNAWKYYIVEKSPTSPNPDTECLMHLQRGLKTCSSFQYSIRFECSTLSSSSSNKPTSRLASVVDSCHLAGGVLFIIIDCEFEHQFPFLGSIFAVCNVSTWKCNKVVCEYVLHSQTQIGKLAGNIVRGCKALPEGGSVWYVRLGRKLVW